MEYLWSSEDNLYDGVFPSAIWALGIEFRSSELAEVFLPSEPILLAQQIWFYHV